MSDWSSAKSKAEKILGDGAEIPELPDSLTKASKAFLKAGDEFKAKREEVEAQILEMDNTNSAFLNAIEQFRARIEKNEFKLDAKKDAKKIQQAQKVLTAELDQAIAELKKNDKTLDELDKHLIQLAKYKQGPTPI